MKDGVGRGLESHPIRIRVPERMNREFLIRAVPSPSSSFYTENPHHLEIIMISNQPAGIKAASQQAVRTVKSKKNITSLETTLKIRESSPNQSELIQHRHHHPIR